MAASKKAKRRRAARVKGAWFVYMIECRGGRIYTGVTVNVAARFEKHCQGDGAAFMRMHRPVRILAAKTCGSRSAALKAEYGLKQLTRADKLRWASQWGWNRRSRSI